VKWAQTQRLWTSNRGYYYERAHVFERSVRHALYSGGVELLDHPFPNQSIIADALRVDDPLDRFDFRRS
jgi:hypothetical protein